jgi:hypothetical protein
MKKDQILLKSISSSFITATIVVMMSAFLILPAKMNAQAGKTSFSGKWAFNETKSNLGEGRGFRAASQLTITQDGNNLSVDRVRTNQNGETTTTTEKFTLDGKECVNTSQRGPSKAVVTWSADGKALNFAISRTFERDGQTNEFKSTEIWTLTDPNTLSLTSVMNFQGEERKTTYVYDKK